MIDVGVAYSCNALPSTIWLVPWAPYIIEYIYIYIYDVSAISKSWKFRIQVKNGGINSEIPFQKN